MIADIINPNKNNTYNIKLAHTLGLELAVYFSTLMTVCGSDDFVFVDENIKKVIEDLTAISAKDQIKYQKKLIDIGLITAFKDGKVTINYSFLVSMFNSTNEDIKNDIKKNIKKSKTKADVIKSELRQYIDTADPKLRDAMSIWIDSVVEKQGWMSKKSVTVGQKRLNEYCLNNDDIKIQLLDIASINGYRDIDWAINVFEKKLEENKNKRSFNFNNSTSNSNKVVELSNDVF